MPGSRKVLLGCAAVSALFSVAYVLVIWVAGVKTENSDSVASNQGFERTFEAGRGIPQPAERESSDAEQARQVTDAEGGTNSNALGSSRPTPTRNSRVASDIDGRELLQSAQESRRGLSAEFPLESRDEDWANAAESALFAQISQTMNLSLASLRVECRETICRLQMVFPSQELFQAYLNGGNEVDFRPMFEIADLQPIVAVDHRLETATANFYFLRREMPSTQSNTVAPAGA